MRYKLNQIQILLMVSIERLEKKDDLETLELLNMASDMVRQIDEYLFTKQLLKERTKNNESY